MNLLYVFERYLSENDDRQTSTIFLRLKLIKRVLRDVKSLTPQAFQEFLYQLKSKGASRNYRMQYIQTIRLWGKCFKIQEFINYPLIKKTKQNDSYIPVIFSDEEIDKFLTLPYSGNSFFTKRYNMWTVFFTIQAYTGCRPGEIASMTVDSVDFGRNIFSVTGKEGSREVAISPRIKNLVENYIKELSGKNLFPAMDNPLKVVEDGNWSYAFHSRTKRLGIKRANLRPYSFRHSFATRLVDEDISIFKIKQAMGHSQVATTEKYVHLSTKTLQETILNDRLLSKYKNGKDQLIDIHKLQKEIEEKYKEKIYTNITPSENGLELTIAFKVKREDDVKR